MNLTRHDSETFSTFLFLRYLQQHEVEFGVGILNKGKKNVKRDKRVPTQIEIMAAVEREKQLKKAAKKEAKVSQPQQLSLSQNRFGLFCF
jgi:hypothetical protein